jgi:hypothetical protein
MTMTHTPVRERGVVHPVMSTLVVTQVSRRVGGFVSAKAAHSGIWSMPREARQQTQEDAITVAIRGYEVRDTARVYAFLQSHTFLLSLLAEAQREIGEHFPDAPLALEVVADPDGGMSMQLIVSICTPLVPDIALAQLDRLDESWWHEALSRACHKLSIILEYV